MRIGFITPDSTDALSFYRGMGPLSELHRQRHIELEHLYEGVTWAKIKRCDLIFLQRPWRPDHLQVLEIAKKWNVRTLVEYDDYLLELPPSNPAYNAFNAARDTVKNILNIADAVMVANKFLGETLRAHFLDKEKPVFHVPNAYDVRLFSNYRHDKNIKQRMQLFLWRGGNSHADDLLSVREDFRQLFTEFPDWHFIFVAQHPWTVVGGEDFPNVKIADPMGIIEYFRAIHDAAPAIMAHPLRDNTFNRCKSMCSWLEATHARAAFIGPDFEEFHRPGINNYGADKDFTFYEVAKRLMKDPQAIRDSYLKSEHQLLGRFSLDAVNQERMAAFESILSK